MSNDADNREHTPNTINWPLEFEDIKNSAARQKARAAKYLALHRARTRNFYSLMRYTVCQLRSTVRHINNSWRLRK